MKKDAGQIGIYGCRGSGKTTRQKELIEGRRRVIVLDPMEQFKKGFKVCRNIPDVMTEIKAGWNRGFCISIPTGHQNETCLDWISRLASALVVVQEPYYQGRRSMVGKEVTLVIDEVDLFLPNVRVEPPDSQTLCRRGRHYGIETIAASTRLALVSPTFRGNCTEQYFFAQNDHNDIAAAIKNLGSEYNIPLRGLKKHEYLHKSDEVGAAVKKGKNTSKFAK